MKKRSLILSATALVVTIASSFAFKTAHKGGTKLWTKTTGTCRSIACFTTSAAGHGCNTIATIYTTSACNIPYTGPMTATLKSASKKEH